MLKNPKHEAFAQAVASGVSAAEAYRKHVATSKTSQATIETTGPKLARDSQIALRIEKLRGKTAEKLEKKFDMSKDKWLERMLTIAEKAEQADDFSAAKAALSEIGKAVDYYAPEKHKLEIEVIIGGNSESQNQD